MVDVWGDVRFDPYREHEGPWRCARCARCRVGRPLVISIVCLPALPMRSVGDLLAGGGLEVTKVPFVVMFMRNVILLFLGGCRSRTPFGLTSFGCGCVVYPPE